MRGSVVLRLFGPVASCRKAATCCLVLLLAAAGASVAQAAIVDVAVSAPGGEAAENTEVELHNPSTGFSRLGRTNDRGRVRFTGVPAAAGYAVRVDGIERATEIRLRSNESRSVTIEPLEEVVVTAKRMSISINALDAEVSGTLDLQELRAVPVEARDLTRALIRLPNVVPSTGFFPEAPPISINGTNGLFTQYLVDGFDNNENFLGGPKFPLTVGMASDVTVLASSYSAEYGRTGNGVVDVTSRSGSNQWHGEAFYLVRPGEPLDADSPFARRDLSGNPVGDEFHRDQFGVSLGGPIRRDQTFFFGNLEYTEDEKENLLFSPALGVAGVVPGRNESLLGTLTLDHRVDDNWQLSGRINHGDVTIERQGGGLEGGVTFPSAGSVQERKSTLASFSATYDLGSFTSETGLGYSRFDWDYASPLGSNGPPKGPQVTVESPDGLTAAILGHPGFTFDEREDSVQLLQRFTWLRGEHAIKFGVDAIRSDFSLAGGGNPAGNYRVRLDASGIAQVRALDRGVDLAVADLPATAEVLDYAVELRPARFGDRQDQLALYVEDQVGLTRDLTLTAGLRWDYDSLTEAGSSSPDLDNFAPRLAVNWRYSDRLAFRAGAGIYYERIPYTVLSDALQQNTTSSAFRDQLLALAAQGILPADIDADDLTFDGNLVVNPDCPEGFLQCPTPDEVPNLRETAISNERRILNPRGLDSPYNTQLSVGVQWQVTDDTVASADLLYQEGSNLLRIRDLNAPAPFTPDLSALTPANIERLRALPTDADRRGVAESLGLIRSPAAADATRPVQPVPGGARQIVVSETGGESRYKALNLNIFKVAGGDFWGYRVTYTLSELANDTDDINFRASNSNRFEDEWGPSINDRRHVISAILYFYPTESIALTVAGQFESGQPINQIPDASIFGTTDLNGDGASFADAYLGNSDRAPGFDRNTGRLPWASTVDLSLRYQPRVWNGRLEFRADVFNVFNEENLSGFANSATQSNQIQVGGQPFVQRNAGAPRQFQFGVRYFF